MKDKINKIRELLDELESSKPSEEPSFKESFNLFELPELIASIIDYLQPSLQPYEAEYTGICFGIASSQQVMFLCECRLFSTRGLQETVIKSFRTDSTETIVAYNTIRDALKSLTTKGVISLAGDVNREGTPYRIYLPEEIAICQEAMAKMQQKQLPQIDPKRELDFYNIKENRLKVFERDKYLCHYCKKQLTRFSATLDHIQPVSKAETILTTIW